MVTAGEFREDLFFRLNVVTITVPPLRNRAEDVVLLANAFLQEFAEENGRPFKPLSDDALAVLRSYSWPGNVRELRTTIEHGVVMSNQDRIEIHHLPAFFDPGEPSPADSRPDLDPRGEKDLAPTGEFNLHTLEMHAIRSALRHTNGNRTKAADLLGISRRTLQRKLKDLPSASDPS
jgi:DNA-binding NtrC family response regulator